jgi:hypothetical protein
MDWADFLRARAQGEAQIAAFGRTRLDAVPIFHCRNPRVFFAATMGLMDVNQAPSGEEPVYTELLLASLGSKDETACHVLASAASCILQDGWRVGPGALLEGVVAAHVPGATLPHLYFTFPDHFDGFDEVKLSGRTIHPLACYPVSEAEAVPIREGRPAELEARWEARAVDPLDWKRTSAF